MAKRRRPFEPDADNTAVGKHDKKNPAIFFVRLVPWGQALFIGPKNDGTAAAKQALETTMQIQLNGKRTPVANDTTIGDLIREKSLDPATVVVEHNLTVIATDDWDHVRLKDNDTLEVLRFVGGG